MKEIIESGGDFINLLHSLQISGINWVLPRPMSRNYSTKITGIILSGVFSNNLLGKTLAKKANIIVLLEHLKVDDFGTNNLPSKLKDTLEIMYKNDIYLICLPESWLYTSPEGNKLLASLFGNAKHLISTLSYPEHHLVVQFSKYATVSGILQRFSNAYPLTFDLSNLTNIESILIIPEINQGILRIVQDEGIDLVITSAIQASAIMYAERSDIKVLWINLRILLNEIARELYYILKRFAVVNIEYI